MTNLNKPITNPELVEAINVFKETKTKENEVKFLEKLRDAKLLAPCAFEPEPKIDQNGRAIITKETLIKFILINTTDGRQFFPAFTDFAECKKMIKDENPQVVVLRMKDYYAMLTKEDNKAVGMVINPFNENLVINKELVERINGKAVAQSIPAGVKVYYGDPAIYPTQMVNAMYTYCEAHDNVKRAWLRSMRIEDTMSFLIVVDFEGDKQVVFDGLGEVAIPLSKGINVNFVPYSEQMQKMAIKDAIPFYEK